MSRIEDFGDEFRQRSFPLGQGFVGQAAGLWPVALAKGQGGPPGGKNTRANANHNLLLLFGERSIFLAPSADADGGRATSKRQCPSFTFRTFLLVFALAAIFHENVYFYEILRLARPWMGAQTSSAARSLVSTKCAGALGPAHEVGTKGMGHGWPIPDIFHGERSELREIYRLVSA